MSAFSNFNAIDPYAHMVDTRSYEYERRVQYEVDKRLDRVLRERGLYRNSFSYSYRSSEQDREIENLKAEIKAAQVKKEKDLQNIIAHYYTLKATK